MQIDKVAIYKAELKPPTGWTKPVAKKYQLSMKIPLLDLEKMGIPAYPFLHFEGGAMSKLCTDAEKKKIIADIIEKNNPGSNRSQLNNSEQKEYNERVALCNDIVYKGDKILRLLSKADPITYDNVRTLLDKIPIKPGYIKPLSPSTIQTPPITPVKPKMKLIKPAGPKMIIRSDITTFQNNIANNLNEFFYSPEGDITSPASLVALHRGIKEAGLRKLRAIHEMDKIKYFRTRDDIEYDLRRYLAGKPSKYVNQLRFNKALQVADATVLQTDEITVKSYHKITGVRKEEIKTLTLDQKEWLLKGKIYTNDVAKALYPPMGKMFGYSLWKIWAGNMQRRLYKYMSTYTEQVDTTKIASLAYVQTGDETPAKPNDIPFIKVRTSAAVTPPTTPPPSTVAVPVVNATPVPGPLATAQARAITQRNIVASQQQVVAQTKAVTLDDTAVSVDGVGKQTVFNLAVEAGFIITAPSALLVSELLHMIRSIKDVNKRIKRLNETDTYLGARKNIRDGLDKILALNSSDDASRAKTALDDLTTPADNDMLGAKLRGTTKISLADANDNILFDGTRKSICDKYKTTTEYQCDLICSIVEPVMKQLIKDEVSKYKAGNTVRITKDGDQTVATILQFVDRTIKYVACDDLTNTEKSVALDEVDITEASKLECINAKKAAEDQVRQQKLAEARVEEERLRLEAEARAKQQKLEQERLAKLAEEEAARKAEEERQERERIRLEEERKLKEAEEAARIAEEEKKRLEEEQKKKILGLELTAGEKFGDEEEFIPLKSGEDILFIVKTSLDADDKYEDKFKALREDKTGHLAKYWYIENPDKQYEKITLTLSGQNYHFDPSITDSEFVISEYAGQVLADDDDNVLIDITPEIVDSALKAVEAIHDLGYVHGDVKLVNMAIKDGKVRLFDFGEPTMSFSDKESQISNYKKLCHKVPDDRESLINPSEDANDKQTNNAAWRYLEGVKDTDMTNLTRELPGRANKSLKLYQIKERLLASEYLLLQETDTYAEGTPELQQGLKNADAILFGGEAGTLSHLMSHKSPTLYNANGYMLISPPFAQSPDVSGNFENLKPLFGNISYQERYKLYDYWALSLALLHMGNKQLKPYINPDPTKLDDKQKLSQLLFEDSDSSWFSPKNKKKGFRRRFIDTIGNSDEFVKILSIIVKGDELATPQKELSKDTLLNDFSEIKTVGGYLLQDLCETWIRGHYNLEETQQKGYTYVSKFTADSLQEELSGDLGEEFYGVSSEIIRKIFEPLYKALPVSGSTSGSTSNRQSLFDYDSFSDAELEELNTEMEALDDEELEKLIHEEISDAEFSYNSSSDTGNSNAAYSYNSESDTGRSNVAYDSSSDTGQSNAAYSYNSESEQSAAESYNDDTYNSDSD